MIGRSRLLLSLVCLAVLACAGPASACPFCSVQGQTLTQEVTQASMVLAGKLANARLVRNTDEIQEGTTDLIVDRVIKHHPILDKAPRNKEGKIVLTLPRYVPIKEGEQVPFLVFCDVFNGNVDPFRGVPLKMSKLPEYLAGALKVKDEPVVKRLKFFFDYLDNEDSEISNDAYKEFGYADYQPIREAARSFPAERIARWLSPEAKTPGYRYGLYASLLAHAAPEKDRTKYVQLFVSLLADPDKKASSGMDGILAGYIMLAPREGLAFARKILEDPKREFLTRYAALRALRFFVDNRKDVLTEDEVVKTILPLLDQGDIADLAIEDFRRWKRWDLSGKILGLGKKESHDTPIVHRCILRYALSSPKEDCKKYVAEVRKKDEQLVLDAEEILKLEQQVAPKSGSK